MRPYIIRFNSPRGSAFAEIVEATELEARETFERLNPDCEIMSSHPKPHRHLSIYDPPGYWPPAAEVRRVEKLVEKASRPVEDYINEHINESADDQ